ncbi:MAG: hypothetical protein HY880_01405 [Deltaproteobacteria bacterium]|nr:hypothetical protein [Deltaproteobacteria bacterium]
MNIEALKENYRLYLFGALGVLALVLFFALTYNAQFKAGKIAASKKGELERFIELGKTYSAEKDAFKPLEDKLSVSAPNMPLGSLIEDFGLKTGIRNKIISFKPIDDLREKDYLKKGVEVSMKGVAMNELVNLLYRIESHKNLMIVEDFSMKPALPDPNSFDVVMEVYLVTKEMKAPEPNARRAPLKKPLKAPSAKRSI